MNNTVAIDNQACEVRKLRLLSGLSQWAVANATGINRSRLSFIECGHVVPTDKELSVLRSLLRAAAMNRVDDIAEVVVEAVSVA